MKSFMKRDDIDNLDVYNMSMAISDEVWEIVQRFNDFNKHSIGLQIVRSADSISANISEGYGRFFYKENRRFCYIARGSLYETQTWMSKLISGKLIDLHKGEDLLNNLQIVKRKLNAYINYIEKQL